jgi:hypothetical protein
LTKTVGNGLASPHQESRASTRQENIMRSTLLALAVLGAGVAIQSAPAQARDYPFCLQGRDTAGGLGDCRYSTYQQCQATASGTYNSCYANPYFAYSEDPYDQPRRRTRRSAN